LAAIEAQQPIATAPTTATTLSDEGGLGRNRLATAIENRKGKLPVLVESSAMDCFSK
jgi:hypothetical protein